MSSWASFQGKVNDRRKLMDQLEEAHAAYDRGDTKSWDLDAARARLLPEINRLSDVLDEEYLYLWSRTGVLETISEWRARVAAGMDPVAEGKDYYTRARRRERERQETIRLERLAAAKEAREKLRSQEAADAATA